MKTKIEKSLGLYLTANQVVNLARTTYVAGREWWERTYHYKVSIASSDLLYKPVAMWLVNNTTLDNKDVSVEARWQNSAVKLNIGIDDIRPVAFERNGYKIVAQLVRQDAKAQGSEQFGYSILKEPDKIVFSTTSKAGQQEVLKFLRTFADEYQTEQPQIFYMNSWGDWNAMSLPPRPLDSVVLAGKYKEELLDDLNRFLSDEDVYIRLGMPWHRGYLFSGPPGTGKTSIVKSVAAHLGLSIYIISLGEVAKDSKMIATISSIPPKSVLLLEDLDVFKVTHDRDATKEELSLSGLLNALDGATTPHGLITFMTSNYPENLDPAIRRPGRVDKEFRLDYATHEQIERMFKYFYGEELNLPGMVWTEVSPSAIVEAVKTVLNDPEEGRARIKALAT